MPDDLPNLRLSLLLPAQARKTMTHNEAVPGIVAFVSRPVASDCCQSISSCGANMRSSSTTHWGCALWSTESRASEVAELIAIGRWI